MTDGASQLYYGKILNIEELRGSPKASRPKVRLHDLQSDTDVELDFTPSGKQLQVFGQADAIGMPLGAAAEEPGSFLFFGSVPYQVTGVIEESDRFTVTYVGGVISQALFKSNPKVEEIRTKLLDSLARQVTYWFIVFRRDRNTPPEIRDALFPVQKLHCCENVPYDAVFDPDAHTPISVKWAHKLFRKVAKLCTDPERKRAFNHGIPFKYPDRGCQYRCHAMARELLRWGVAPMKAWAFPTEFSFFYETANHPNCVTVWDFHCAAALQTTSGYYVVDPSTQPQAVPIEVWRRALGHQPSRLHLTSHHVLDMSASLCRFRADPDYRITDFELTVLRISLRLRTLFASAPPYQNCIAN